jgi:tRNA(Ile)-lysidine synthase
MLSAMLRTISMHGLMGRGDRVLVAVSGGPDSMALLHALWEARERLGVTLEVAGIDHGLRPAAGAELALVRERSEALGLPYVIAAVDVRRERARGGVSLQDAARRVRLGALATLAGERGATRIALGHQADDQAETVLYRILRGTGIAGLRGIPYRRGLLVRPLLDVRRVEILRYLRRRSIPFVEDPSNADLRFARARIRHKILPALADENPRVAAALIRLAESARANAPADPALAAVAGPAAAVVRRLRARGGTAALDVAGGRQLEVSYGRVRLRQRQAAVAAVPTPVIVDHAGRYRFAAGGSFDVRIDSQAGGKVPAGEVSFDADRLAWPLMVRVRRPGDRMRPRGGRGSRKLSDLMIDAKIARPARATLPVLTSARGDVLLVPGLRPADVARPSPETRRFVRVIFRPRAYRDV